MSKEAETEAVLNHLLFHKALIDEDQDDCRMDRYLEILSEAEAGEALSDPMDESIRAVFHLVLNQGFDPWDIDLMEFTRLYAGKIKGGMSSLREMAESIGEGLDDLTSKTNKLKLALAGCHEEIISSMLELRKAVDSLEKIVSDERWPLPKYREMLFIY
ncbi:MAG: hypothetical protein EOM68_26760, partial [Spirochaetia bacterium]|nr:hypothetical protein [Spirochaetia bacterium]